MVIRFIVASCKKDEKSEQFVHYQLTKAAHVRLRGQPMVVEECSFCRFDDSEREGWAP